MPRIVYETCPISSDIKILSQGLDTNAKKERNHKPMEDFAFFIRDADDKIVGGCNGILYYGCLFIDQLWVSDAYRKQKYGTKLLQAAERLAKSKGCLFSTLETMDWEALEFYRKFGYYLELERSGYLNNSAMYCLRKDW